MRNLGLGIISLGLAMMLLVVLLAGCEKPEQEGGNATLILKAGHFRELKWDECSYVMWRGSRGAAMAHKGNCSNHE